MFENKLYYRVMNCGKRNEYIKNANLFFRNWKREIKDMQKEGLGYDECLRRGLQWLKELERLELSIEGTEWYLLHSGYQEVKELFGLLGRSEDELFCECKEFECGWGLLSFYKKEKELETALAAQIELGRRIAYKYGEKRDLKKAYHYFDASMDYLISAQGLVSAEKIDALFKAVAEDREEISQKMKK